jgi:hypothetical protein
MNLPLPTAGTVDPWQEILSLLAQKVTYKGQPIAGTPEQIQGFARWMMQNLPGVVPDGDPDTRAACFLNWLRSETSRYEADTATRMAQAQQTPPANPISDQNVAQQAQPVAAPAPAPAAPGATADEVGGLTCPECGAKLKNLTGMKRHCTMTHKSEWAAIAQKHGLDISTGLKLGQAAPVQAAPAAPVAPPPPPSAAPVPPMFGSQGQASAAPSFVAPGVPGQNTIPFTAPAMPQPPAQVAASPQAPLSGPATPMFTPPTFAQAPSAPVTPPQPPAQPAGPMVAFNPAQAAPVSFPAQLPPQQPQQGYAPVAPGGAPTRESMAQMLGGAVDLIVVRLLDAAAVNLQGRTDVNQLALLAEQRAKAEQKVVDLAQSAYGAGKQAAQRHFADLLTQHPGCYLLQNGYEPILPAGYLEILAARVTKFHIVTDSGRQTTTIFA